MRRGFTLVELLLGGAILAMISFGALIGILRVSDFVDKRGELMAADGFCWDLAWKLFNEDADSLRMLMTTDAEKAAALAQAEPPVAYPYPPRPETPSYLEIKGTIPPGRAPNSDVNYDFLSNLQYPDSPPTCYIVLSNRFETGAGYLDDEGVFISVNLEWGPKGQRRILVRRADTPANAVVFDHPVEVFRSFFTREPLK